VRRAVEACRSTEEPEDDRGTSAHSGAAVTSIRLPGAATVPRAAPLRPTGLIAVVCQAGVVFLLCYVVMMWFGMFDAHRGIDERMYHEATARWLAGGPWYLPHQLAGPYVATNGDVLYPPVALLLFVPFQWLPAQLWYAIPTIVMAWGLWTYRPAWWAWVVILVILWWPPSIGHFLFGNPVIWCAAFLWIGLRWAGPAVLVLLKPVLFPFAFVGAHRRSWWIALGLFALACLPFGTMWLDYMRVVLNAQGTSYLLLSIPLMLIPLLAWGSSRGFRRNPATVTD
jgi:hypothetical protein